MSRLFGTDGVRGVANTDITCELSMAIGRAIPEVFPSYKVGEKTVVVIGKDTRRSSDMIEAALIAGLCSAGVSVVCIGVVPTPAVPFVVRLREATAGVMISASHNPYEYNGIKLFDCDGLKLADDAENEIEKYVLGELMFSPPAIGKDIGEVVYDDLAATMYVDFLIDTIDVDFKGMKLLVDCANGSASRTASELFNRLGAQCDVFHDCPNGININHECGSTYIDKLATSVKSGDYFAGVAFDGDADRFLAVDENGDILDGDKIIAAMSLDLKNKNELNNNTAVVTVMSNLGLFNFFEENNINYVATQVGDRYVLEEMIDKGYDLGGEQSGHVIFGKYATTGDGQLTAIKFLAMCRERGITLSKAGSFMRQFPQTLIGVKADADQKRKYLNDSELLLKIKGIDEQMGKNGRVLVRPSGTEPLIRIMIEGKKIEEIEQVARAIAKDIERCIH